MVPVVLEGPQGGTRASDAGQVSASLTFTGWLERQPAAKVAEILGKGRAELYRAGKITLMDLTSGAGRPLTLEQLKTKYIAPPRPQIHADAMDYVQSVGKKRNIESALIYDPATGKEIFRKTGAASHVEFADREMNVMRGNVIVHNHPGAEEANLSLGDYNMTAKTGAKEIIAVTPTGTQFVGASLKRIPQEQYNKGLQAAKEAVKRAVQNTGGKVTPEILSTFGHALSESLQRAGLVSYRVETPSAAFTKAIEQNKALLNEAIDLITGALK
jgi:hypothetical protein